MSDELKVEVRGRVGILTMNRPDKLNALTIPMNEAAVAALQDFSRNHDVGAVVLTGEGKGFCAGGDVSSMQKGTEIAGAGAPMEERVDALRKRHDFPWWLHNMPKVTLALVNGAAAGAGLGLALSCDLRLASDKARFSTAYAKVGYGGDYGTTWKLTRLLGEARAKELFFLPDVIGAEEALSIGLVNRVFAHETMMEEAMAVAARIASGPLVSYRHMKANINLSATMDFRSMLDREAETHIRCGETEDHKEGVNAFMEKREPRFAGR